MRIGPVRISFDAPGPGVWLTRPGQREQNITVPVVVGAVAVVVIICCCLGRIF